MSSNFSKNLTSSMGISLGGLEVVTDFLFTNPEFYEAELLDVKNNIFGQNANKQSYNKPVRPKKTKEAIMRKFNILQYNPIIQEDEVFESPTLVGDDAEFDFDFTEYQPVAIEEIEDSSEILEANSLMQRLANMNNVNDSIMEDADIEIEDTDEDISIYSTDDMDGDIEIEDDFSDDFENSFEDNIDALGDFEDDFDDSIEDSLEISDDDFELDIDDGNDEFEVSESSVEQIKNVSEVSKLDSDTLKAIDDFDNNFNIEGDLDEYETDDLDIDDNFEDDLEIEDGDSFEIEDGDSFEIDVNSGDNDVELDIDILDTKVPQKKEPDIIYNNSSEELKQMQRKFAEMEKQLHELRNAKAIESASNIKDNVNKDIDTDNIDKLLNSSKSSKAVKNVDRYAQYSSMSIETLYSEVKEYMIRLGVKTRAVELSALNERFGEINIRKLIQKSYLIKIGSKGVTVGR